MTQGLPTSKRLLIPAFYCDFEVIENVVTLVYHWGVCTDYVVDASISQIFLVVVVHSSFR